ncbi:MAG: HDOD domain-containing protein [Planctomycetes bacterium]|nr:HDOD domain-containing protein [Planctomycetota bacterium]
MIRLLFVDDEVSTLADLRNSLSEYEGRWEMQFATSAEDALELLEGETFDVVVADMHMEGMDGNAMFEQVRTLYPDVVRVMTLQPGQHKVILESTRNAHRYLPKPLELGVLEEAVAQCSYVRSLLDDAALRELVVGMTNLPSLPSLYTEIVRVAEDETKTFRDAGAVVSKDTGMTSKVLQLVNSALFGIPRHIGSVEDAVGFLGVDTLKSLVLSVKLFTQFGSVKLRGRSLEQLADHNLRTGLFAQKIAAWAGAEKEVVDHAFLAGTLHDAGILILAAEFQQRYAKAELFAERENVQIHQMAEREFGTNHARVGAYLLSLWGLPDPIIEAVLLHHGPSGYPGAEVTALTAVHVANAIEHELTHPDPEAPCLFDFEYLRTVGVDGQVDGWLERCRELMAREDAA